MSPPRKSSSPGLFREMPLAPQTPHDKTAAAAKLIIETEATKRADRTAALKEARLARDAAALPDAPPAR
ncbi:hypothetical protein SAMN04244550_01182 [Rhodobacter capsulatus]|uniref:Uncharacterized protein n=2 Tax=Rhodobacter capsulatus TaxID=1061 RepID=A0A1G7G9R6_RHOCA|nr:hypothetical protein SAMN04244550_01182 [Rhodobacter capsulatus]